MKHLLLTIPLFCVFLFSCKGNEEAIHQLEQERDSLLLINEERQMMLDDLTNTMAEISLSLDSISFSEQYIRRGVDENGNPLSRKEMKNRLASLSEIISSQRDKMSAMQNNLNEENRAIVQMRSIIAYLNETLEQKDAEIQQLKREVDNKNFNIAKLNTNVAQLKDTVEQVRQENESQKEQITRQQNEHEGQLNEVFYVIGTKEELLAMGVLSKSGKIIKKTSVDFANINRSALMRGDKRKLHSIIINGKSPKVLSPAPKDSYVLERTESGMILNIIDTERFWSSNNRILVIQTK